MLMGNLLFVALSNPGLKKYLTELIIQFTIMLVDPKKVLLVEDDDFLRDIYLEAFSQEGYILNTAIDGNEAYQKLKDQSYDLVIMDIILPGLDGLSVLKKLQEEATIDRKKTVILVLTNLDSKENIKEALDVSDGYLIKSQMTPGDLMKEVKIYLQRLES